MYRTLTEVTRGLSITHDGRLYASGVPEPEWLLRRYRHAEELRALRRERAMVRAGAPARRGLVERLRMVLARD